MFSKIPDASGIYRITCIPTGKFYIGSAVNLRNRWNDHLKELRHNTHRNPKLQRAWNKYHENAFTFDVLELVLLPELLIAREQCFFDTMKPFGKRGFNIAPNAGSTYGRKFSQASLEKMSTSHRGQPSTFRGKTHSLESREKMRLSHRGQPASNLGKHYSADIRKRMSDAAASRMKTLIFISPDGAEITVTGITAFCKEHGLLKHHIMEVANGKRNHHKGWKARFPD